VHYGDGRGKGNRTARPGVFPVPPRNAAARREPAPGGEGRQVCVIATRDGAGNADVAPRVGHDARGGGLSISGVIYAGTPQSLDTIPRG